MPQWVRRPYSDHHKEYSLDLIHPIHHIRFMAINTPMKHQAGTQDHQKFALEIANYDSLLPLFLEDWCLDHCAGPWCLESDGAQRNIHLSFMERQDEILFMLSRYHRFIAHKNIDF